MNYYIGTAGFSYRDWEGIFYPKAIDKLNYYSSIFNFVEINSTFYEIPEKHFFSSFASRLREDFKVSIKANKLFTHQEDLDIDKIKKFIDLVKILNKNLLTVLFQFPYSFHNNAKNLKKIELIKKTAIDIDIAIEVRHKSFLNDKFLKFCQQQDIIFVNIDQPMISYNLPLTSFSTNEKLSYFRFHGRKENTWFENNIESFKRYDYLYNDQEIEKLKETILQSKSTSVIISFNNHYRAKAVINALEITEKLGEKCKISSQQIIKAMNKKDSDLLL